MKLSHQLLLLPRLYNNTLTDVLSQQKRRHFSLCRGLYDFWENVIADIISVARNNGVLSIKDHIHMLQHFLLMYVLETHERRKVISATVWNRSESEPFLFWSCLRHIICFSCELDCIHFHRVYQWWHAAYVCWQNRGLLLCMRPTEHGHTQLVCF